LCKEAESLNRTATQGKGSGDISLRKENRILYDRFRILFTKEGDIRFISHLDLMRLMDRAIRRAGLPAKMTEGFNPHIKLILPFALPVGIESRGEILDLFFPRDLSPEHIKTKLSASLPEGTRIESVRRILRKPQSTLSEACYQIRFPEEPIPTEDEIHSLLSQEVLLVEKQKDGREEKKDILPFLHSMKREKNFCEIIILNNNGKTARVEEVIRLLGRDPLKCRIVRTGIRFLSYSEKVREKQHRVPGSEKG